MKHWILALSLIALSWEATAKCVFDRTAAQPVLKLLEIPADTAYQLNFPIRSVISGGKSNETVLLIWDPKLSQLTIEQAGGSEEAEPARFPPKRFVVWMPEFLEQPGAKAKWKTLLQDLEGATSTSEPPPADTAKVKTLGVLRYPAPDKKDVLELIAYKFKNQKGRNMKAEGADEQGRWLSIRCGPPVSK